MTQCYIDFSQKLWRNYFSNVPFVSICSMHRKSMINISCYGSRWMLMRRRFCFASMPSSMHAAHVSGSWIGVVDFFLFVRSAISSISSRCSISSSFCSFCFATIFFVPTQRMTIFKWFTTTITSMSTFTGSFIIIDEFFVVVTVVTISKIKIDERIEQM